MDPISTLAGMLDTSAFEEGSDAFGTKVSEEYMQIINKLNDSITGLNEVAVDQLADEVIIEGHTTSIAFNAASIVDLEVLGAANADSISDNADDIAALSIGVMPTHSEYINSTYSIPSDWDYGLLLSMTTGDYTLNLPSVAGVTEGRVLAIMSSGFGYTITVNGHAVTNGGCIQFVCVTDAGLTPAWRVLSHYTS